MNFTLGGAGAGLAVATWLAQTALDLPASVARFHYPFAAAIIAAGLLSVFFEIGRKRRFLHALRRPQTSWMSREIYAVGLLYLLVAANLWQPRPTLAPLIAASAAAFLYCQARILHAGKGIPAWRAPLIPWMLLASGLFEGFGALLAVLFVTGQAVPATEASPLVLLLAALNGWLWRDYRADAEAGGIGPLARDRIDAATPWLHAVGHAVPVLLALAALAAPAGAAAPLLAVAGVAACAGGAVWKIVVVTRAAHFQNLDLPRLPRRGSGTRSAFAAGAEYIEGSP
ncbi:MAG: polysulfide reductase NrfD [Alphaproteobacteria bacterium]|nr:polysulfide reductase NrfD [Alphaproteobacteria bacterium]